MIRTILSICLLVISSNAYSADPASPSPTFRIVDVDEAGNYTLTWAAEFKIIETRTSEVPLERVRREYKQTDTGPELIDVTYIDNTTIFYTIDRYEVGVQTRSVVPEKIRGYKRDGSSIDQNELKTHFKDPRPALVSVFENSVVDPQYLQLLNESAVLLVVNERDDNEATEGDDAPPPPSEDSPPHASLLQPSSRAQTTISQSRFANAGARLSSADQTDPWYESEPAEKLIAALIAKFEDPDNDRTTQVALVESLAAIAQASPRIKDKVAECFATQIALIDDPDLISILADKTKELFLRK